MTAAVRAGGRRRRPAQAGRAGAALLVLLAAPGSAPHAGRALFVDVAAERGILHHSVCGSPGKETILDTLGTGACWLDYDGDGDVDLFLPNGSRQQPIPGEQPPSDALFRNDGGRFTEVSRAAGVASTRWAVGCAVADYDADGDVDLFVSHYGRDALYRNNGDGTFVDTAAAAGVADEGWGTGAAFADYDGDGWLDLYVARYVLFDPARAPAPGSSDECRFRGMPVMCGPRGLIGVPDLLYRNRGDGTFTETSAAAGLKVDAGYYGLGVVWGDYDDDGDPDLYVANDSTPNLLYRNSGDGTFREEGVRAGVGYSSDGREQAGMGVDFGDYDGDGRLDLFVTNFSHDFATLYRNDGGGFFTDDSFRAGLVEPTLPTLGWGTRFFDYDLDGDLDLFLANGHVYPEVDEHDIGSSYDQLNQLFENDGRGRFTEITQAAGPGLALRHSSRAAAVADFDDDGDWDVLVTNIDGSPNLLENRSERGPWLRVELAGRAPNLQAVGARVILTAGGRRQAREVRGDGSYLSYGDPRPLFGAGAEAAGGSLEVRWPDGRTQKGIPVPAWNRVLRLSYPSETPVPPPAGRPTPPRARP